MSTFHPEEERQQARDFVIHYLKDDGVFLTRLLSLNSSDLVVTELINQLWTRYKNASRHYAAIQQNIVAPTTNGESGNLVRARMPRIPMQSSTDSFSRSQDEKISKKDTDV